MSEPRIVPPGPTLGITAAPAAELSDDALLDRIIAAERLTAWAQAQQLSAMAALLDRRIADDAAWDAAAAGSGRAGRRPTIDGGRSAVDEIAMALRIPRVTAGRRVDLAATVTSRLPATLTALTYGEVDLVKVRIIAEATGRLTETNTATVEEVVVPLAGDLTSGQLKVKAERVAAQLQPDTVEADHAEAADRRRVIRWALPDGMAEIRASLTADGAAAVWTMLSTLAETARHPDEERSLDQLRADVLTDLAIDHVTGHLHLTHAPAPDAPAPEGDGPDGPDGAGNAGGPDAAAGPDAAEPDPPGGPDAPALPARRQPTPTGRIPRWAQVHLLIPADLLAGRPSPPAELTGHGPIPTSLALHLAADADWHRLIYDPDTGGALALSSRAHDPPTALREFIHARDRTCTAPGCRQPRTDLDHRIAHHAGGATDTCNLGLYCRHHHRLKQHPGWQTTRDHHGTEHWTTPTGRTHHAHQPDHRPEPC